MIPHDALTGKAAIVTGASRGIGRCIALTLASHGCSVALAARNSSQLQTVAAEVGACGGQAMVQQCDMACEKDIVSLVDHAVARFGRLDIVVNNAGMGSFGPLADATAQQWDTVMSVNARGPFLLCRQAIPHLAKQKPSYIVNITSVVGIKGYENQSIYSASKHAVMGWTKALAREVQKQGIRVHAICPGAVDTDMVSDARPDLDRAQLIAPQEVADVVLFLVTRTGKGVVDLVSIRREGSTPWG
jgi:3-oxoacyl-[acyl-carrier protein] reductase